MHKCTSPAGVASRGCAHWFDSQLQGLFIVGGVEEAETQASHVVGWGKRLFWSIDRSKPIDHIPDPPLQFHTTRHNTGNCPPIHLPKATQP